MAQVDVSLLPTTMEYFVDGMIEYLRINLPDDYQDFLESNRLRVVLDSIGYEMGLLSYYMNANLRQMFLPTASTREAMFLLGKLVNYTLRGASPSSTTVTFSISSVLALDVIIPALTQVQASGNPPIIFEVQEDTLILAGDTSVDSIVIQGTTIVDETVGTTSVQSLPGQTFTSTQPPLLTTISLSINNIVWTQVDNLFDATSTDRAYTAKPNETGLAVFTFGNGIFGAIPPSNSPVLVTYRVGGGTGTNSPSNTITELLSTLFDEDNNPINVSVTNATAATGGTNQETIEEARINIPRSVRSMDRFVSREDFQSIPNIPNLISGANGTVFKSTADVSYTWAIHLITIYILDSPPTGSLTPPAPTQALLDEVQAAVEQKTLETISISVLPATLLPIDITGTVYYLQNYRQDIVTANVTNALSDLFDPTLRNIGDGARLSDIYAAIDSALGVDYLDLSMPSSNVNAGGHEFVVLGDVDLTYTRNRR